MSELDVIVIHIRAEQAAEYERLFAERELPRWREYKARGAFISARIFRAAFGTDRREDVVKYVIAVEVPSHVLAPVGAERGTEDPGAEEGAPRLVLAPARQLTFGKEALVLRGLLGADVDDDDVQLGRQVNLQLLERA